MTSIHPVAYVIIGIIISGYSKFVEYKNTESYLEPFFWVGLIFVFAGLVKFAFRRMNKESEKKQKSFEKSYEKVEKSFEQQNTKQSFEQKNYPDYTDFNKQKPL